MIAVIAVQAGRGGEEEEGWAQLDEECADVEGSTFEGSTLQQHKCASRKQQSDYVTGWKCTSDFACEPSLLLAARQLARLPHPADTESLPCVFNSEFPI